MLGRLSLPFHLFIRKRAIALGRSLGRLNGYAVPRPFRPMETKQAACYNFSPLMWRDARADKGARL